VCPLEALVEDELMSAYVSIRQHTSAYHQAVCPLQALVKHELMFLSHILAPNLHVPIYASSLLLYMLYMCPHYCYICCTCVRITAIYAVQVSAILLFMLYMCPHYCYLCCTCVLNTAVYAVYVSSLLLYICLHSAVSPQPLPRVLKLLVYEAFS
jgi:hypothetical protein